MVAADAADATSIKPRVAHGVSARLIVADICQADIQRGKGGGKFGFKKSPAPEVQTERRTRESGQLILTHVATGPLVWRNSR